VGREDVRDGFVLDGFPRILAQSKALDEILREIGRAVDAVVVLEVPDEVPREHPLARGREDDSPEVIENRLRAYHEQALRFLDQETALVPFGWAHQRGVRVVGRDSTHP
jgi:adenylate kinase family enzyme